MLYYNVPSLVRKQRKQKFTLRISLVYNVVGNYSKWYYSGFIMRDYKNHPYAIELFEQANVTVKRSARI